MVVCRLLFASKYVFEIQWKSADIGLEFANLKKIKHMRHVLLSVLVLEFEFEDKNNNF